MSDLDNATHPMPDIGAEDDGDVLRSTGSTALPWRLAVAEAVTSGRLRGPIVELSERIGETIGAAYAVITNEGKAPTSRSPEPRPWRRSSDEGALRAIRAVVPTSQRKVGADVPTS